MAWRTRATDEIRERPPSRRWFTTASGSPATWCRLTEPAASAYAIQVTYDTAMFGSVANAIANFNEGDLWLGAFNGTSWQNAVTGITRVPKAGVDGASSGVNEPFSTFWADAQEAGASTAADVLGAWGVDTPPGRPGRL